MSSGLGFTKFAARYLSRVMRAGGTTANHIQAQAFEKLAIDGKKYLSLNDIPVIAVWPFFGGTADAHAINLFGDDLIEWTGTITHNSNGITGGGSASYGTTGISPSNRLSSYTRVAFGVYSRTNSASDAMDLAQTTSNYFRLQLRSAAGLVAVFYGTSLNINVANASSAGLTHFFKSSPTVNHLYRNGALLLNNGASWSNAGPLPITILRQTNGTTQSTRNLALVFFSDTVSDQAAWYAAVQAYQTSMGRQV